MVTGKSRERQGRSAEASQIWRRRTIHDGSIDCLRLWLEGAFLRDKAKMIDEAKGTLEEL